MTAQLSRERLEKIASWHEKFGADHNVMLPAEEAEVMARMLLAGMDSEPVAYFYPGDETEWQGVALAEELDDKQKVRCIPLYAAPPATVDVPDAFIIPEIATLTNINKLCPLDINLSQTNFATGWNDCRNYALNYGELPPIIKGVNAGAQGWNACRAAMLKSGPEQE